MFPEVPLAAVRQARVWACSSCGEGYPLAAIQAQLLAVVRQQARAYSLQDLRCVKCKQVRALWTRSPILCCEN